MFCSPYRLKLPSSFGSSRGEEIGVFNSSVPACGEVEENPFGVVE